MAKLWSKQKHGFWENFDSISPKNPTFPLYKNSTFEDHNQSNNQKQLRETNKNTFIQIWGFPQPKHKKRGGGGGGGGADLGFGLLISNIFQSSSFIFFVFLKPKSLILWKKITKFFSSSSTVVCLSSPLLFS